MKNKKFKKISKNIYKVENVFPENVLSLMRLYTVLSVQAFFLFLEELGLVFIFM